MWHTLVRDCEKKGNGVPEMAGPLLGDARSAPALGMFFVVPETYQCGTACNCDDTETARPRSSEQLGLMAA